MSYLDWHAGMKVVALRDGCWSWEPQIRDFIVKGSVYTISAIMPSYDPDIPCWVVFEGCPLVDGEVSDFDCRGFRPVQTRATDISIFTAMLTGTKQTERA